MSEVILGIDVGKQTLDVALLVGTRCKHRSFANVAAGFEQLARWLEKQNVAQVWACLEATSTYWEAIALALHPEPEPPGRTTHNFVERVPCKAPNTSRWKSGQGNYQRAL